MTEREIYVNLFPGLQGWEAIDHDLKPVDLAALFGQWTQCEVISEIDSIEAGERPGAKRVRLTLTIRPTEET